MAEIIIMPKLGFNMSEGKLVTWYKKEGDEVRKNEPLFAIETDKTTIDIEATGDGSPQSDPGTGKRDRAGHSSRGDHSRSRRKYRQSIS